LALNDKIKAKAGKELSGFVSYGHC